jgi:GAF domain-containing protein
MEKLRTLLEKVVGAEKADKANIQMYYATEGCLKIVAQIGFEESFLQHFGSVKPFDSSTCGRAFGIGSTVLINDVEQDIGFRPHLAAAKQAGYRSVKSVPVFGSSKACIGVVSTHFREPKWNWEPQQIVSLLPEIAVELERVSQRVC